MVTHYIQCLCSESKPVCLACVFVDFCFILKGAKYKLCVVYVYFSSLVLYVYTSKTF